MVIFQSGFHMRRLIFFDSIQRLACTTTSDNDLVPLHQIYKHLVSLKFSLFIHFNIVVAYSY